LISREDRKIRKYPTQLSLLNQSAKQMGIHEVKDPSIKKESKDLSTKHFDKTF